MAKGSSLNRKKIITEELEHQKEKKQGTSKKSRVNIIDYPSPHELLKSYLTVEAKIITSVWLSV